MSSAASARHLCVNCLVVAPEGAGELLTRSGWRLTRRAEPSGAIQLEWRCPECAARSRRLRALTGQSSGSFPSVRLDADPQRKPEK